MTMCGPFCSVPPTGTMATVLPFSIASRISVQVISSMYGSPGLASPGACAATWAAVARTASARAGTASRLLLRMSICMGCLLAVCEAGTDLGQGVLDLDVEDAAADLG